MHDGLNLNKFLYIYIYLFDLVYLEFIFWQELIHIFIETMFSVGAEIYK